MGKLVNVDTNAGCSPLLAENTLPLTYLFVFIYYWDSDSEDIGEYDRWMGSMRVCV